MFFSITLFSSAFNLSLRFTEKDKSLAPHTQPFYCYIYVYIYIYIVQVKAMLQFPLYKLMHSGFKFYVKFVKCKFCRPGPARHQQLTVLCAQLKLLSTCATRGDTRYLATCIDRTIHRYNSDATRGGGGGGLGRFIFEKPVTKFPVLCAI
jgi:hypothetical protein